MSRQNDVEDAMWSDPSIDSDRGWPHCGCPLPETAHKPAPGECWCVSEPPPFFLSDDEADRVCPILPLAEREGRPQWSRPKWKVIERTVFLRDAHRCQHCGSTSRLVIDHVWPLARGGLNTVENLQTLCDPCNAAKGTRMERKR